MSEADLQPGQKVGEYVIEGKLGEGGFGAVYRASHPMIGKLAAVKVLARRYSSDPQMVSRFAAEARAVNQIRHSNIIDIFAFGQLDDGRSYYVMELLEGHPLDKELDETGGLPLGEALPILDGIARALDAAHAKGIAHRDLKPENVFLSGKDGVVHPKLLDFGIAKLLGDASHTSMHRTRTGAPMGTPYYMSPEQCRGQNVDHRTDIYSFGILAYQLLTGRLPFEGAHHLEIMMKQTTEEPMPPSQRAAQNAALPPLPTAIDDAIAWIMKKEPSERPPNLASAMKLLEDAAGIAVEQPTRRSYPALPMSTRTPSGLRALPSQGHDALAQTAMATEEQAPMLPTAPVASKKPLWISLALLVAGAAIAVPIMLTSSADKPAAPVPAPLAQPAPPTPAPAPAPAPAAVPEPPRLVTVTIKGVPDGTEVFGPEGPLGFAPGPIKLVRGSDEIQLVLRAAGHHDKAAKLVPDGDRTLELALEPQKATVVAKPKPKPTTKPVAKPKPASDEGKKEPVKPTPDPYARH